MSEKLGKVIPFRPRKKAEVEPAAEVTFKDFAQSIMVDDLESAARCLELLFHVDLKLAKRCAGAFHSKIQTKPDLFPKTMEIREKLEAGEMQEVLVLLGECFEAHGVDGIRVLSGLTERFGVKASK